MLTSNGYLEPVVLLWDRCDCCSMGMLADFTLFHTNYTGEVEVFKDSLCFLEEEVKKNPISQPSHVILYSSIFGEVSMKRPGSYFKIDAV